MTKVCSQMNDSVSSAARSIGLRAASAGTITSTTLHTPETKSASRFQPAVEGGRIYVGTQDGKLICIDTGDKTLTGWNCWGGNPQHTGIGEAKK